ncbi:hypothetical protein [Natronoglycomyces albus]|uniref:Uncharacterized protein n=1 Tax=Natronoglycomyces albus TaxID=2811108 RepID=A0A895XLJ4_9ACTN|nr:hypothetical protein [Natronoglycomyces albus]QSB05947.1 hypothetical protein JQS30_03200 [Natronoglycomyces albus]
MNDTYSSSVKAPKTTSDAVVEFVFNFDTYMISPHPKRGAALALTMQGRSMPIRVATILIQRGRIHTIEWETPFSGYPPEWQTTIGDLVTQHCDPVMKEPV